MVKHLTGRSDTTWRSDQGRAVILDMGQATLEIFDEKQADYPSPSARGYTMGRLQRTSPGPRGHASHVIPGA